MTANNKNDKTAETFIVIREKRKDKRKGKKK